MEIYKAVTFNNVDILNKEIDELENKIKNLEAKHMIQKLVKNTEKVAKIKLNYALNEERFNYEKIKKIEQEKIDKKTKAKIGIDSNWLTANLKEPDIFQFYDKLEMVMPYDDYLDEEEQQIMHNDEQKNKHEEKEWEDFLEEYELNSLKFGF